VNPNASRLVTFAGGNSFIATADPEADTITLINTLEGSTQTISLPSEFVPTAIAATLTTNQILVSLQLLSTATTFPTCGAAGIGAIGVINITSAGTATLDNAVCGAKSGFIPGFIYVMPSGSQAFILDQTNDTVSVLNLAAISSSSTMSPVLAVGKSPIWATPNLDGNRLYVLNQGSNDISVIDPIGLQVITLSITPTHALSSPSVIITDSLNRLYISNTGTNVTVPGSVSVLDASTAGLAELHAPITVGKAPIALAATLDGASVYVANTGSNFASVINANNFNVTTSLTPDPSATATVQAVAVSKNGTKAFIGVTVSGDQAIPSGPKATPGNGIYVVLTSNNSLVTTASGPQINIAPPQDLSCDSAGTCAVGLLQRPVQIVPEQ
jgi:YVTN family beta-propeller protein